jgi:uncharacterized membrane protein
MDDLEQLAEASQQRRTYHRAKTARRGVNGIILTALLLALDILAMDLIETREPPWGLVVEPWLLIFACALFVILLIAIGVRIGIRSAK